MGSTEYFKNALMLRSNKGLKIVAKAHLLNTSCTYSSNKKTCQVCFLGGLSGLDDSL